MGVVAPKTNKQIDDNTLVPSNDFSNHIMDEVLIL